jgi:hypothetical protein
MLLRLAVGAVVLLLSASCGARTPRPARYPEGQTLPRIGYSVQVGAFASPDNAWRLVEALAGRGLEAFYFAGADGLHKVRFGSFASRELALRRAGALRQERIIEQFFVVSPDSFPTGRGVAALRRAVVRSAESFLGRPYHWGGSASETGLDCSGLTMTAYRLNGLALPRASAEQFAFGEPVSPSGLQEADLVFFGDEGATKPTHVGLYVGEGRFIHAPSHGGVVRIDALVNRHYQRRLLGGRSYVGES